MMRAHSEVGEVVMVTASGLGGGLLLLIRAGVAPFLLLHPRQLRTPPLNPFLMRQLEGRKARCLPQDPLSHGPPLTHASSLPLFKPSGSRQR